ncbi:MAG: leucine-rich repeat protein [Firmicutes bacterium]|nr:leucine-rich repeat protein [Bacillota bacterium]
MPTAEPIAACGYPLCEEQSERKRGSGDISIAYPRGFLRFGRYGLTGIEIPNSVTTIGRSAFYSCIGLTSIEIPSGVTTIGSSAFQGCSGLTGQLKIPANVTSIGVSAFEDCTGLTSLSFAAGSKLEGIGSSAFYRCDSLTGALTLPADLTFIGQCAFAGSGLTSLSIAQNVSAINDRLSALVSLADITVDPNNMMYSSLNGVLFNKAGTTLICYPAGKGASYTIPAGVSAIGASAFHSCTGLTSITIPGSVTGIGDYAFYGCTGLTSITLSNSVTAIGYRAFYACNLTIYTEATNISLYKDSYNSSYCTIVWGCTLSVDKTYVVSFAKDEYLVTDGYATLCDPYRVGYTFDGWYTNAAFTSTRYITSYAPPGGVWIAGAIPGTLLGYAPDGMLYAKWV